MKKLMLMFTLLFVSAAPWLNASVRITPTCDYNGAWFSKIERTEDKGYCVRICEQKEYLTQEFSFTDVPDLQDKPKLDAFKKKYCVRFCEPNEAPKNNSCVKICKKETDKDCTQLFCQEGKILVPNHRGDLQCHSTVGNASRPKDTDSPVKLNEKTGAPSSKTPTGGGQSGSQGRDR